MPNTNANTALLVMDVQAAIIDRVQNKDAYLALAQQAVDHAHALGMRVFQIVVAFRPGAPEASEFFRAFAPALVGAKPVMTVAEGDVVVEKKRISAFAGSDLEVLLRANSIQNLVLCGVATSGVVLSTAREASDKDYSLTILSDLCFDPDAEVHRVLLEKVLSRQAKVVTAAEWMAS